MGVKMRASGHVLVVEGDQQDSNPRPSEPQSADTCFYVLPGVAEYAYLSRFIRSRLPNVTACCVLSGVNSGVKWHRPLPIPTGLIAPREDLARTTYGPRKVSPPSLSMRRSSE